MFCVENDVLGIACWLSVIMMKPDEPELLMAMPMKM